MAWTTVSMPPVAVSTTTGWLKPRERSSFAGLGVGDGQALALQHSLDQATLGRVVIDDKNRLGHATLIHRIAAGLRRGRLIVRRLLGGPGKGGVSQTLAEG